MSLLPRVAVFSLIACMGAVAHAQTEFNIKAGVSAWSLKDEKDHAEHSRHPGQMAGFDVWIEKNRALFSPGFHYRRISINNEDRALSLGLSSAPNHMHFFTIPLTGGYTFYRSNAVRISGLTGAEISFFYALDDNDAGLDDDLFYGISTALTALVHFEIATIVTAELRYHLALQPILKNRDQSKLRGVSLLAGVKF